MFTSLCGEPSSFFRSCDDHLKVLSLSGISDVDDSIGFESGESVFNTSEICGIVVVATVRLDYDQGIGVFFNKNTLGFSFRLVIGGLFSLLNWSLLLFLFSLFLLIFLVSFLDLCTLLGDSGVFLD